MLEAYEAYGNYDTMAILTREFVQKVARDVFGSEEVTLNDGTHHDLLPVGYFCSYTNHYLKQSVKKLHHKLVKNIYVN